MKNFSDDHYYNQILFETSNYKVIPSLGSLVEGWLLIVPKKHFISIGAINDSALYVELEYLTNHVLNILKSEYGDVVLFEHGPVESCKLVGCGVDYAHLHLVPTKFDLVNGVEKYFKLDYKWEKISSLETSKYYFTQDHPYLFIQDQSNNSYITTDNAIPSQLFRKVIANELGIPEKFDWKENFHEENIKNTILKLSRYSKNVIIETITSPQAV